MTIDLSNALVIVHPALTPIGNEPIEAALAPATFKPTTSTMRFSDGGHALVDLADADWPRLIGELDAEREALRVALANTTGDIFYFGMAPIPIAIELGTRITSTRRLRPFQQRHDTKSWGWPESVVTVSAEVTGVPGERRPAKGDVIIRVSCSHTVAAEDTRAVIPYAIGELDVSVPKPHEDVLQSEADVTVLATKFGEALDAAAHFYPNADNIHLFAAVPPALAVRMGAEINPTIHATPIQTYQFAGGRTPRFLRALVVGHRPAVELDDDGRAAAVRARQALRVGLNALKPLADLDVAREGWLVSLLGGDADVLPRQLADLGPLGRNRAIVDATVSDEAEVAGGEFHFDPETRRWSFDDHLLAALGRRLNGADLETAARLFLLHEAVHDARQGLTAASAERVGRLPRVLEELDYLADVWALVHDYALASRNGTVDAPTFFRDRMRVMTAIFWAFDAADLPLRTVQVRRLNRYLIWYWLRLSFGRADTLADCLRLLSQKPVLEISGPRTTLSAGRIVFDLDPVYFDDVELGVLADGYRLSRVGDRAGARVRGVVDALRTGDEAAFLNALRGVFDGLAGGN